MKILNIALQNILHPLPLRIYAFNVPQIYSIEVHSPMQNLLHIKFQNALSDKFICMVLRIKNPET